MFIQVIDNDDTDSLLTLRLNPIIPTIVVPDPTDLCKIGSPTLPGDC